MIGVVLLDFCRGIVMKRIVLICGRGCQRSKVAVCSIVVQLFDIFPLSMHKKYSI